LSEKPYIRNPKGQLGLLISEQDIDDYEQEKQIQEWLEREGKSGAIEFKHINRKGNARNTLVKAHVRLDQAVGDEGDGTRTFADIIAGSDGRDLECGVDSDGTSSGPETATERLNSEIDFFTDAIGLGEGTKKWIRKTLQSAESLRQLRSLMKEEKQSEISPINLELQRPWGNFKG
jgi:hypothetical protein